MGNGSFDISIHMYYLESAQYACYKWGQWGQRLRQTLNIDEET